MKTVWGFLLMSRVQVWEPPARVPEVRRRVSYLWSSDFPSMRCHEAYATDRAKHCKSLWDAMDFGGKVPGCDE